jgi:3-carboxy-cis,cis-muconate cycloisomerase
MSEPAGTGLLGGILERGRVVEETNDVAWLRALLDAEAALARAEATVGLISSDDAGAIEQACRTAAFDAAAILREARSTGTPVVPLVERIVRAAGPAGDQVHRGATSQDIVDTATMLVAKRALVPLLEDLAAAADLAGAIAATHRDTPMVARTLLQQALPTTLGLKVAGWMTALDEAAAGIREIHETRLAAQLGGAAGTLAALGDDGLAVAAAFAAELGLAEPALPWHTDRVRVAELACALGVAVGAAAKPARDLVLLAQTEVAEVHVTGPDAGGSSTLPQKRNPVAAVAVLACAHRAPGLVATLLAAMPHEHERAAGLWHAEWAPLQDLLVAAGSAAAWLRTCLEHLEFDTDAMHRNLAAAGGPLVAERIVDALAPIVGRRRAGELVREVVADATGRAGSFDSLLKERVATIDGARDLDVAGLLDPTAYLGSASALVARALAAHDAARSRR